jgi:ring-1,2-phenylacetyl-CoA epoxidase subunit PaaD
VNSGSAVVSVAPTDVSRTATAWQALASVEDPEIPAVSIVDLGLVRFVRQRADGVLEVGLSPTYVGCPATDVIRQTVESVLSAAQVGDHLVTTVLSPPWSSDWITPQGRRSLEEYGIVPPERTAGSLREVMRGGRPIECPRCRSLGTETLSEFGSTPCKSLHRCMACMEPFEYFKCI